MPEYTATISTTIVAKNPDEAMTLLREHVLRPDESLGSVVESLTLVEKKTGVTFTPDVDDPKYRLTNYLDRHTPDDTTQEISRRLFTRIDPEYWSNSVVFTDDDPWAIKLAELDERLAIIDPDYRIVQMKEKFGELRFMIATERDDTTASLLRLVVSTYEGDSTNW